MELRKMSKSLLRMWSWFKKIPSRLGYTKDLLGGRLAIADAELSAVHIKADGTRINLGTIARKKVTGAFVTFIVAQMVTETSEFGDFKFHDCGTGSTAEANTQTALVTPYGGARVAGTQVAGGVAAAPTYTSVATIPFTGTLAIVEHAIFSIAAAGTMLDRSLFAAVNVVNGDSIQFTYVLTINAEA
jgi:hypothetical protein